LPAQIVEAYAIDLDLVLNVFFHWIIAGSDEKRTRARIAVRPGRDRSRRIDRVEGAPPRVGIYRLVDELDTRIVCDVAATSLECLTVAFDCNDVRLREQIGKFDGFPSREPMSKTTPSVLKSTPLARRTFANPSIIALPW
jgi:hypothetical protein